MISTCPKFSTTTHLTDWCLPKQCGSMNRLLRQLCTNHWSRIHISHLLHIWHACNHVRHIGLCLIVKKSLAFASKHRQVIECSTTNSQKQIQRETEWKRKRVKWRFDRKLKTYNCSTKLYIMHLYTLIFNPFNHIKEELK